MSHHNDTTSHHHAHPTALQRFFHLMSQERGDMIVLITYTMVAGLTALAVPLATQALVNIVAAGVLVQPLVVLTILVYFGMVVTGILQLMKLSLVERLQQRVFARVALEMAHRMVNVRVQSVHGEYAPELINRFFDVLTIQKTLSKLLLDGLTVTLQALVGLVLLAVYSPVLLGFDIIILLSMGFIIGVLGIGGLRTSIVESKEKYRVADGLKSLPAVILDLNSMLMVTISLSVRTLPSSSTSKLGRNTSLFTTDRLQEATSSKPLPAQASLQ